MRVQFATSAANVPEPHETDATAPSCSPHVEHDSSSAEARVSAKAADTPIAPLANSATDLPSNPSRRCSSPASPPPTGTADQNERPSVLPVLRAEASSPRSTHVAAKAPVALDAAGCDNVPDSVEAAPAVAACRTPLADVACVNAAVLPRSSRGSHGKAAAAGRASHAAPHCSEPSSGSAVTHAPQTLHYKECNSTTEAACMCAMNHAPSTSAAAVRGGSGAGGDGASSDCADATPTGVLDARADTGAGVDDGAAPGARASAATARTQARAPAEGVDAARACGDNRSGGASAVAAAAHADGVGEGQRHAASAPSQLAERGDAPGGAGPPAAPPEDTASALARQRLARFQALSKKRRAASAPGSHSTSSLVRVHSRWASWRAHQGKKGRGKSGVHSRGRAPLMPSSTPLTVLTKYVRQQLGGTQAEAVAAVEDALARAAAAEAEEAARAARASASAAVEAHACGSAGAAPAPAGAAATPHAAGEAAGQAAAGDTLAAADVAARAVASAADAAAAAVEDRSGAAMCDATPLVDAGGATEMPAPSAVMEDTAAEATESPAADAMDADSSEAQAGHAANAQPAPACSTEAAEEHTVEGAASRSGFPRLLIAVPCGVLLWFSLAVFVVLACCVG